jgi:23S rRNA-/tRNA-specific pseudouridylate synthase
MQPSPPPDTPIPVIAWGTGWMAVNKPSGMSVHNEPGEDVRSRLSNYLAIETEFAAELDHDPGFGLHAVHRLDKETSGVLLLACRRQVLEHFAGQFAAGAVRKLYLALVHGMVMPERKTGGVGRWEWPLTKSAGGRGNPRGQGKQLPCSTLYSVLQTSPRYSLLECELLTGRKHQVRRHAALAGHAVLGDSRYGSMRACRYLETHFNFRRLALHAAVLEIRCPQESAPRRFEALPLPPDIQALLDSDLKDISSVPKR